MASEPIPVVRLLPGVVVSGAGALAVNVAGSTPPVWWPAGYIPTVGDAVKVLLIDGTAHVLGPVTTTQRTVTGTVSGAASSGLVPVDTTAGTVQARYVGTAPSIGSLVFLDWQATTPRLMSSFTAATTPASSDDPAAPAAPPSTSAGTLSVTAIDSGTWNAAYTAWSSFHKTNLVQGTYSGQAYSGAWFYGAAPSQLAGRTVTAARIRLGARLRLGSYNSPLTLNLYRHTSNSRPGGDVSRVAGPSSVVLAVSAPAQWVALDTAFAQALVDSGGGIGISGGTYGGVYGIGTDPASGQLQIDWEA